jgi:hypothetical protein
MAAKHEILLQGFPDLYIIWYPHKIQNYLLTSTNNLFNYSAKKRL